MDNNLNEIMWTGFEFTNFEQQKCLGINLQTRQWVSNDVKIQWDYHVVRVGLEYYDNCMSRVDGPRVVREIHGEKFLFLGKHFRKTADRLLWLGVLLFPMTSRRYIKNNYQLKFCTHNSPEVMFKVLDKLIKPWYKGVTIKYSISQYRAGVDRKVKLYKP
jgi:hypothetical protein